MDALSYKTPPHEVAWISRLYPIFGLFMKRGLQITHERVQKAHASVLQIFDEIDQLSEGNFLIGNTLSIADISFAALSAPVILPPNYDVKTVPDISDLPTSIQDLVHEFRQTDGGRRVLRIYENYR